MAKEEETVLSVKEKTKKTKMVLKTVPEDQVKFVLATKPLRRHIVSPPVNPQYMTDEIRRQFARVDEIINSMNESTRKLQEEYRHELATKGKVEFEVEVTDDESD